MATNMINARGENLLVTATEPATPSSGDPVLLGQLPAVALVDEDSDGNTSVQTVGVFDLEAEAVDNVGNNAIAAGDILYYDSAASIKINKDSTNGVRYGYALEAIGAGSSDTIKVKLGY